MSIDNKNGVAVTKKDAVKIVTSSTPTPADKGKDFPAITAPAPDLKKEVENLQTFEERLHRLNQLWELQGKYAKLDATSTKLNAFTIDAAETSELQIEDSEGKTFTTSNSEIIGEVIEFIKKIITDKRKALQPLINW